LRLVEVGVLGELGGLDSAQHANFISKLRWARLDAQLGCQTYKQN